MLTTSPAVSRTLRFLAGIQDDDAQPAAQPSFAPEDYSSSVIAPPPPPAPTFAAPFQDDVGAADIRAPQGAPPPPPPPARDDYRLPPTPEPPPPPPPPPAPIYQPILDAGSAIGSGINSAVQTVQDAYAVPPGHRPPQYSGPSYAQPRLAPGQRPYFAPTETETAAFTQGVADARAAEPIERVPIPFTTASVPIPAPLQWPAGAVAGGLEALNAADQAVRARIDPRVWGFAHDGIRRELFTPEQLQRDAELRGAMDPVTGARHTTLTPAEQDELAAMDAAVDQRYQQIKDDPDALTRYANASPAYGPTSALTDIALTPALGAAAGGAATRGAEALGAGARTARGIGYGADIAAQSIVDPTTPFTQGPLDAAVRGGQQVFRGMQGPLRTGVRGVAGALADAAPPTDAARAALEAPGVQHLGSGVVAEPGAAAAARAAEITAYNAAQGGVLGGASEVLQAQQEGRDVDPATMAQRALIGGGLGVLAGSRAARGAARRLGSGIVPGPSRLPIDPAQVAAEATAGPRRGALLNQKLDPPGSQVPRGVRAVTALTDDLAATRWAEDLLTQASGRGRLAEDAPERASTLKRINADSVTEQRIARELAPVVATARQEGLLDELVQYVQDTHEADVLQEFYRRSHDEALAAGAPPAAADAAGMARMQRRSSANPDLTWEAVGARLQGQQQRLGAQAKRLDELAQGIWDHNRDTLDHLRQSGRISQDQYDWLTQTYPHYVPTVPISHLDPGGGTAAVGRGGGAGVSAGRKTAGDVSAFEDVASPAERLNPIIASREATIARGRAAQRNDVFQAFARLYDEAQQAAPHTLQTSQGARKNRFMGEVEVSGRVDGQPVTIRMPKPVADMIDTTAAQGGAGAGPMALWRKAMSAVTTSTTGRRAAFLPVNLARDFNDALLRAGSEYGVTAIPEYLGLWMQEAGNAAVDLATGTVRGRMQPTGQSAEYLARGGGMGRVEGGWKAAEQWYDDVQRTGGVVVTDPKVLGGIMRDLATFKPVMAANERTELISRTAMMRMAERRGATPTQAMIAGRNASIDFERAGQITRMFNGAIPFLNATVQSGAQLKRTLTQHPRSAAATFATVVGVPVAAAEAYNRSDPNRAAAYNDVPQYVKDQGIVLMLPWSSSDTRGDRPNYLWLPLGMGAPVAIAVREAMRKAPGLEPSAGRADVPSDASEASRWETVLSQILSVFSPIKGDSAAAIASSMVPPVAKQAVELGLNRSLYTGAPIASDTADERASSFGHAVAGAAGSLGRAVGSDLLQEVRPSHVDYAARQLPAYGDVLTGVSDMIAPSAAKQEERRPIANAPLVGGAAARIVRDVGGANLERAQSDMLSPTVRDALAEAGMRPSDVAPVQGSISVQGQQMPLLRDEQVDYQERTTSYADREIDAAQRSADWRAEGADRESLVRAALTKARQKAADEVVRGIPPAERRQRIREAAERKAS